MHCYLPQSSTFGNPTWIHDYVCVRKPEAFIMKYLHFRMQTAVGLDTTLVERWDPINLHKNYCYFKRRTFVKECCNNLWYSRCITAPGFARGSAESSRSAGFVEVTVQGWDSQTFNRTVLGFVANVWKQKSFPFELEPSYNDHHVQLV